MIHRQRAHTSSEMRKRGERHRTLRARHAYVQSRKRRGVHLILRLKFDDHSVLIVRSVDGRDLPGSVSVEQNALDLIRSDAKSLRLIAVYFDIHLRILNLKVGGQVLKARQLTDLRLKYWCVLVELLGIGALQSELIQAFGQLSADPYRRR